MDEFLLDTCVFSETSRPRPNPNVMRFLAETPTLYIPAAALMEVQIGITLVCATDPVRAVKLSVWYQQLFEIGPILPMNQEVAEVLGTLAADNRLKKLIVADPRAKRPATSQDLHIAAVALVHRLPIATMNVKDFLMIDACYRLPGIYNPAESAWFAKLEPIK